MKTLKVVVRGIPVIIPEHGDVTIDNSVLPDCGGTAENLDRICKQVGEYLYAEGFFEPAIWESL